MWQCPTRKDPLPPMLTHPFISSILIINGTLKCLVHAYSIVAFYAKTMQTKIIGTKISISIVQ